MNTSGLKAAYAPKEDKVRRFVVVEAVKNAQGGKNTQFNSDAVYTGTPGAAAKKAFSRLCRPKTGKMKKAIRGRCALTVTVQEIGEWKKPLMYQDGTPKQHTYKLRRVKLDKPIKLPSGYEIKYNITSKSVNK
tara:strand:- start:2931 stop:3329 length:399 start_codon:yes stop_codon:yes gene_type:complete